MGDRERRLKRRLEALNSLGGLCECCEESNPKLLTIDHLIEGDARITRKTFGRRSSDSLVSEVLRTHSSARKGRFRVLCFSCNFGRQYNGGTCPHQEE